MVNPTSGWDRIPVFGFFFKGDDVTPETGNVKFTMTSRVTRVDGRKIYPEGATVTRAIGDTATDAAIRDAVRDAWRDADQAAAVAAGDTFDATAWNAAWNVMLTGAVFASFPASDDPNIVETGYQVTVTEGLDSGTGRVYTIQPQLSDLQPPTGMPPGINLGFIAVPPGSPIAPAPIYAKGLPGGVAALDSDGDVVDAAGDKILGGGGGTVDTSTLLVKGSNLSDVPDKAAARTALQLGTAATHAVGDFEPAGAVASEATARQTAITAAINALVNGAPGALDTLNELAAQLGSDETAAGNLTTLVGAMRNLSDPTHAAALSATFARSRTNVFAALGTSITDQNKPFDQGGGATAWTGAGYMHWANANLRQALTMLPEFGVSGDTTGAMLARINDVIAAGPSMVLVETGPNDVQGDSTFEIITSTLANIYTALRNAGILVFAGHICPTETIMATAARQLVMHRVNRWMNQYARANRCVIVVPWAAPMTDPATGSYLAGTLQGSPLIHPNTLGASIMGKVLADTMAEYVTGIDTLPYSNTDPTNLIGNGLTLGSSSGGATGWTFTAKNAGVFTKSKVARNDGDPGEWQQIQVTSATGGLEIYSPIGTTFTPGTSVVAEVEVDAASVSTATQLEVQCWGVDGTGFPPSGATVALGLTDYYASVGRSLNSRAVLRSYPLTLPATGITGVRLMLAIAGPSTVRFTRAAIKDVNA